MSLSTGSSMNGARGMGNNTGGMSSQKIPGYRSGQMQNFSPEQMQLFQQMFGRLGPDSFLSKIAGGDQSTFDQMEAPALQQFAGIQANTAGRFSGQGMGSRRSSGFQHAQNQASSDFAQQLQSNRMGLRRQAMMDLSSMSNELLGQKPFENYMVKKPLNFWKQFASSLGEQTGAFADAGAKMFGG